tara:strand:+ start:408 stop:1142 length:735 start_codon:yes stop_codon:yes gene_type:complete
MPRKSRNNGKVATSNQLPARVIQSGADVRRQLNSKGKSKNNIMRPFGVFGQNALTFERAIHLISSLPDEDGVMCIYDKLIELEEREKLPCECLVKFVRNMNEVSGRARWKRAPPETATGDGSFHCWLEDADGMIIDHHFKEYDDMMKMARCNSKQKVYVEWTDEQQKEKLKNLLPDIMENINENAKRNGIPKRAVMALMARNPGFRACCVNAWSIKSLRPELRFVIGNMGFRSRDDPNKVWWEY